MKSATPPPLPIRKLRATMEIKWLDLREVADIAETPYTRSSEVLSGTRNDDAILRKLRKAIHDAPSPESLKEVAA